MVNKKKIKQRKKRQMKRTFKAIKVVTVTPATAPNTVNDYVNDYVNPDNIKEFLIQPPIDTDKKHEERNKAYQKRLDAVYNGTVVALTNYVNDNCSMTFKCNSCGVVFFGKAGFIAGKVETQYHSCHMPYGMTEGERGLQVSSVNKSKAGKTIDIKQFQEMIWEDYSYQDIAKELKVNPDIIRDYFISEGLIGVSKEDGNSTLNLDNLIIIDVSKRGRKAYKDNAGQVLIECTKCNEIKGIDLFSNRKTGFMGKNNSCKACDKEYNKQKVKQG